MSVSASGVRAQVPVHALLLGEENSFPTADVARIIGALLYPSTRLPGWPMVVAACDTADEAARERLQQFARPHHKCRALLAAVQRVISTHSSNHFRDATGPIRVPRVHASTCFLVVSGHRRRPARHCAMNAKWPSVIVHADMDAAAGDVARDEPARRTRRALSANRCARSHERVLAPRTSCIDRFALMHEFLVERKVATAGRAHPSWT
jgi:hypothetical protein